MKRKQTHPDISQAFKVACVRAGLTKKSFAAKYAVTDAYVQRIVTGYVNAGWEEARKEIEDFTSKMAPVDFELGISGKLKNTNNRIERVRANVELAKLESKKKLQQILAEVL